jgi:hypothetical protein
MKLVFTFILIFYYCFTIAQSKIFPIALNGKWGIVNEQSEILVNPIYDYIEYVPTAKKYIYYLNGNKGLLNHNAEKITNPIYDNIKLYDTLWQSSFKNGFWNLFSEQKTILPHQYKTITKLSEALFFAKNENSSVLIDVKKQHKIEGKFNDCELKDKNLICTLFNSSLNIYNKKTLELIEDSVIDITEVEDLLIISKKNKQQLFNKDKLLFVGNKMSTIKYVSNGLFYCSLEEKKYIFNRLNNKYYELPLTIEFLTVNFPYVIFKNNNLQGVFDLVKHRIIIEPKFENISFNNNGFLVRNFSVYGFYSKSGKIVLPCNFKEFTFYDYFIVTKNQNKLGLYTIDGKLTETNQYDKIKVFDSSVKCYRKNKLVVIRYNDLGEISSKNTYQEYLSVSIEKEKLPKQKFREIKFGGSNSNQENSNIAEKYGWFRPIRTRKVKDSTVEFFGRWGLKDDNDSIRIRPRFAYVDVIPDYNLTKAYLKKPYLNNQGKKNKYIKLDFINQVLTGFQQPFILVNQSEKKILSKKLFYYLNEKDFKNNVLARGFNGDLVLVDQNANIIYENLTYYDDYFENKMRICANGNINLLSKNKRNSVSFIYSFLDNIGAIHYSYPNDKSFIGIDNGSWYFINSKGKQLNKEPYQFVENFRNGFAIVKKNNKWGVIDSTMKEIVPIKFDNVIRFILNGKDYFKVYNSSYQNYFYTKSTGNIQKTNISKLGSFKNGVWAYMKNGDFKWGLIDTNKNVLIENKFNKIYSNSLSNTLQVVNGGKKSIILYNGEQILPYYKTKKITELGNDRFLIVQKRGNLIVNGNGDTLLSNKKCKSIADFTDEYLIYKNFYNELVLSNYKSDLRIPKNTTILSYSLKDNILLLKKRDKIKLYNFKLQKYISKPLKDILKIGEKSMIYKGDKNLYGYMSFSGDTLTKAVYKKLNPIKNGWAFAIKDKKRMFINSKGELFFEIPVVRVKELGENYLINTKKGVGIADKNGKIIIKPNYKNIEIYNSIFYKATNAENKKELYAFNGVKIISKPFEDIKAIGNKNVIVKFLQKDYLYNGFIDKSLSFQTITPFSYDLFLLTESLHVGIYDSNGKELIPIRYHTIDIVKNNFQVSFFNSFGFYTPSGKILFDPYVL